MAKTKKVGKTMREDSKGNRTGKYGKVKYSSKRRKSRSKREDDGFGLPEW